LEDLSREETSKGKLALGYYDTYNPDGSSRGGHAFVGISLTGDQKDITMV